MDELFRAIFGLPLRVVRTVGLPFGGFSAYSSAQTKNRRMPAWPGIAFGQRRKWRPFIVTVLVTIWMIPGWWFYNILYEYLRLAGLMGK